MQRRSFMSGLASAAIVPATAAAVHAQGGGPKPTPQVQGPDAPPGASRTLAAVMEQFRTMTQTRYQHKDEEYPERGVYYYDCVGMVTFTIGLANPAARDAMYQVTGIRRGFVPSPARYVEWISWIASEPNRLWERVPRVADVRPGDILAWVYEPNNPTGDGAPHGHSVIAAGPPLPLSDGTFALLVYDSTASFHGPFDTRRTDPRNLPLEVENSTSHGNPSGLGRGTIQLIPDPTSGAPVAVAWTVGTHPNATSMETGRVAG